MGQNQNVEATGGDRGPSYWDVDRTAEALRETWGIGLRFVVVPPLFVQSTNRRTSWTVAVQAWRLGNAEQPEIGAQASYGTGGAWKTMPQAMHAALRQLETKLEEKRQSAERQARF